ncbi:2-oxo-4-hydroxy-4-carboxy-5-ureidoimidazoline decarboxylase [Folsomia candida]|nr:2-oxo-4-hydroxy-4-carboxy-5-ureidoimidazoline decarboxylase [Folsomia candida]
MSPLSINQVNEMEYEDFISTFGNVVEHCSLFAAAIWSQRPFHGVKQLHKTFCDFIDTLPKLGKEGILRSHPDLAGRIAERGLLTTESTKEQLAAELNTLTPEEKANLTRLNEAYKTKFGFPFVICARDNKKAAILSGLEARLENETEKEVIQGVEEVKKIAFYRLLDILQHEEAEKLIGGW